MPLFTAETARDAAKKSYEARWGAEARARRAQAQAEREADEAAEKAAKRAAVAIQLADPERYVAERLNRVRAQIDRLSTLLDYEKDPRNLDRLAAAIERLHKAEFALAGRPMPGQRRPAPERRTTPPRLVTLDPLPVDLPAANT